MNDAVVVSQLDKIIQLLSKRPNSEAEPQRKKVTDDGKEQLVDTKPKEPREIVKKAIPVRVESYSTEGKKFWGDLFSKASSTKTDKVVAEKKEDGGGFFGKLLKILGGIAIAAVLIKYLLPFIKDKVFPFLIDMFKTVTGFITTYILPLLKPALKDIVEFLTKVLPKVVGEFFDAAADFFKDIWEYIGKEWPDEQKQITKIWKMITDFFDGIAALWEEIRTSWYMEWEFKFREAWESIVGLFKDVIEFITKSGPKLKKKINKTWNSIVCFFNGIAVLWEEIRTSWHMEWAFKFRDAWDSTVYVFKEILTFITDDWPEQKRKLLALFSRTWKWLNLKWTTDWEPALANLWNCSLVPFFKRIWKWLNLKWTAKWGPDLEEFWDKSVPKFFNNMWEKISPHITDLLIDGFIALVKKFFELAWEAVKYVTNPERMWGEGVGGVVGKLFDGYSSKDKKADSDNIKRLDRQVAQQTLNKQRIIDERETLTGASAINYRQGYDSKKGTPGYRVREDPIETVDKQVTDLALKKPLNLQEASIDLTSKKSLALQTTSVSQNAKIVELLATNNRILAELNRNNLQKPGNTTIVNAPKTTSLSYNTSSPQSSFRQGIA